MQITVYAPAKINLTLDIVGVREDGYHLLESIFQSVSIYDTIVVKKTWGRGIRLVADKCDCPVEKNTAYKAAQAFFRYTGLKKGVKIKLEKHIPQQAGMGGGSADAAGVLWALNRLFDTRLTIAQLCEIGLTVGAIESLTHNNQSLTQEPNEERQIEEEEEFNEFLARLDEEYEYAEQEQTM